MRLVFSATMINTSLGSSVPSIVILAPHGDSRPCRRTTHVVVSSSRSTMNGPLSWLASSPNVKVRVRVRVMVRVRVRVRVRISARHRQG